MRIVLLVFVILLALAGAGGATFFALGVRISQGTSDLVAREYVNVASMEEVLTRSEVRLQPLYSTPANVQIVNNAVEAYVRGKSCIWFLFGAAALALFGIVLAAFQQGKCAAAVFLAAFIGPAILMPPLALPFFAILAGALPVAGLLAIFIRPKQPARLEPSED
jgi:hypothetical protein